MLPSPSGRTYVGSILFVIWCGFIYRADTVSDHENFRGEQGVCSAEDRCQNVPDSFQDTTRILVTIEELISIASSGDIHGAAEPIANLRRIKSNLQLGTVKAGVIGLTKSGKSTFLNAILGKQYLPSSIQPQTAKQISITHAPGIANGQLYAGFGAGHEPELIATGWEDISAKLIDLNTEARQGNLTFQKLSLSVPIIFLEGANSVKLEISDTPGLYEAVAGNISFESELAVKEMCAFILILNLRLLKTESEANIIKSLMNRHPELFSKLSRILILVNAYDIAFYDDSPGGLRPNDISSYVAEYLQDPNIIGLDISPQQIIPFSAKWALYARMWSSNPSAFLKTENARILYDEAVILMRRATNYESHFTPFEHATAADVHSMCTFLLEFSHIKVIEEQLDTMLFENGPAILLEATTDDSTAEIHNLLSIIELSIESQHIEEKKVHLTCLENLLTIVNEIGSGHISTLQPQDSTINSVIEALRGTLSSKINSIFQNHLVGFHLHKDRNAVFNRICSVKPLLTDPANAEMLANWNSASSIIRQKGIEHTQNVILTLKTDTVAALTAYAKDNIICQEFALHLSGKLAQELDRQDSNSFVPTLCGLSVQANGNSIANDRLNHIWTSYETLWKTTEFRKKKKKKWGGRKRKAYYSSTSYQSAVFSPDLSTIQSVFTSDAINPWVQSFRSSLDSTVMAFSNELVEAIAATKTNTFSTVQAELQHAVENSRQTLTASKNTVSQLSMSKHRLIKIQDELTKM